MSFHSLQLIFGTSLLEIRGLNILIDYLPYFMGGALITLGITALSVSFGMIIGLFFGLFKLSNNKILYYFSSLYIDLFRGTPLFVQALLFYFGILPAIMGDVSAFHAAIIVCSLNSGAYIAEIVRAGIQAVDKGQMEAASSLGMNYTQAMLYVILPQAYKVVIPPLINEFIMLLKDTSIMSIIGAAELVQRGRIAYSVTYEATWIWGGIALIYFVMTKVLSILGAYTERRLDS
ncbi:MAG TPA: amino acid ABC transporter permease [Syntrophomonadaceae bacterium]|nr:amino acid ABC transporter permease [Syntrophomonadaceae bacterium]